MAKLNRNATPSQTSADLAMPTGTHIFARTISHPLKQVGLYAQKPVRCIPFQSHYYREILLCSKKHIGWVHQQCSRVMFSDESDFAVISNSGHQFLRKEREACFTQHYVRERDRYDSVVGRHYAQ